MKLFVNLPKTAFLLSSLLVVSVCGGRKTGHHLNKSAAVAGSSPVATPIVEADATSSISQPSMAMVQSRSASIANERAASASYNQPVYSSPYDPSLVGEPAIQEAAYYDAAVPTSHQQLVHQQQQQAAASGLYHHHLPAPVSNLQARHAAGAASAAASAVTPYAAAGHAYGGHQGHQGYGGYGGYGYDYPAQRYVAQGSHHHDGYVHKRAHGYGWHPDLEVQTLFFIGIPLIIIPLLFLWPYFLYSLHSRGGHYGGGGGGFGYRSASEDAEVVTTPEKELKAKTDELTKKVLPKLSKTSKKSSKSSTKSTSKLAEKSSSKS